MAKTKLRSTVKQESANALLFLFTEQEFVSSINRESVIDDFKNVSSNRRNVVLRYMSEEKSSFSLLCIL